MKQPVVASSPAPLAPLNGRQRRALVVDLNNFATFPTLAVGMLMAALRNAGFEAVLLSPLAYDTPASERERADTYVDHIARRVNLSTWEPFRIVRDFARRLRRWWIDRPHPRVLKATAQMLAGDPDIVLLSAYLQHYNTVVELAKLAHARGIPVLLGGPVFNIPHTGELWRSIPGLTAIVGAEVDLNLADIVSAACDGGDLLQFEGVVLPDGRRSAPAKPLRSLNQLPIPDYTDFPWDRYRVRIVPVMAGRGCQWDRCNFCSDVISASGRTYRNRSVEHVLHEMREQARRCQTENFLFLDLKLNSNPALWRGLIENIQRNVRGAQWIGTVHVDDRRDNGLSRQDLRLAAKNGMRRISFGLESGSQTMLDAMDKGCTVERNETFIRDCFEAGISVRGTMIKGFPGEDADDLLQTAEFLERNGKHIDRIRYNDFSITVGTPIYETVSKQPELYPNIHIRRANTKDGRASYVNVDGRSRAYRKAKLRVLHAVYEINRRKILSSARVFDGLM